MSALALCVLIGTVAVSATVLLTAPRLLVRPFLRDRLWRLRDEVAVARRGSDLPYEHHAPLSLVSRIEATIAIADDLTLPKLLLVTPAYRRAPAELKEAIREEREPDLSGMSDEERALFARLNERFMVTSVSIPFLSTWAGIACVLLCGIFVLLAAVLSEILGRADPVRALVLEQEETIEAVAFERAKGDRQLAPAF